MYRLVKRVVVFAYSIFLVDHAWTYEIEYAEAQLKRFPDLLQRMSKLMEVDNDDDEDLNSRWTF